MNDEIPDQLTARQIIQNMMRLPHGKELKERIEKEEANGMTWEISETAQEGYLYTINFKRM